MTIRHGTPGTVPMRWTATPWKWIRTVGMISLLFSELGHATGEQFDRLPGFGTGGLGGDGGALRAAQGLGRTKARRELVMEIAEDRAGIGIGDRRQSSDHVARPCSQKGAAEGERACLW